MKLTREHVEDLVEEARLQKQAAHMGQCDLSNIDLAGAHLAQVNFQHSNLQNAILRGANLSRADLTGANLSGSDLEGANLSSADLSGANFQGANLSGAKLTGADMRGANVQDARLHSAVFVETKLWDTDVHAFDTSVLDLKRIRLFRGGPEKAPTSTKGSTFRTYSVLQQAEQCRSRKQARLVETERQKRRDASSRQAMLGANPDFLLPERVNPFEEHYSDYGHAWDESSED